MVRIRIKSTPPGFAPEEVRKCWVGLELETMGKEELDDAKILIGREGRSNLGGYKVTGEVAFSALREHSQNAYAWWMRYRPELGSKILIFASEVCEEISE